MSYNVYTQYQTDSNIYTENKYNDRYQAEYDYNGSIDSDGDSADYYRPIYAIRMA